MVDSKPFIVSQLLRVPRMRKGNLIDMELSYVYRHDTGTLDIFDRWHEGLRCWRRHRIYEVMEFEHDLPGRAFRLFKSEGTIFYDLLLSDDGTAQCDCRGHVAHGHCCHADVLRALTDEGQI